MLYQWRTNMKYIDAELIQKKIDKWVEVMADAEGDYSDGVRFMLEHFTFLLDSLQQEQDSVAERFARIVRGNLIGIDKEVQQKFENLYFEITGNKMYGGYND